MHDGKPCKGKRKTAAKKTAKKKGKKVVKKKGYQSWLGQTKPSGSVQYQQ